jgi:DinB superfamily
MSKEEIIAKLEENHNAFIDYIHSLKEEDFNFSRDDKWTAGQQLEHINRAVRPLTQGFILPKFFFSLIFGKSSRPSRSYDQLVDRYHQKLESGGRASGRFIPPPVTFAQRDALTATLRKLINILCKQVNRFSENDLDTYILPHPLLGKLTIREMMYFTIYHVQHHQSNIAKALHPAA